MIMEMLSPNDVMAPGDNLLPEFHSDGSVVYTIPCGENSVKVVFENGMQINTIDESEDLYDNMEPATDEDFKMLFDMN